MRTDLRGRFTDPAPAGSIFRADRPFPRIVSPERMFDAPQGRTANSSEPQFGWLVGLATTYATRSCSVDGCDDPHKALGFCASHYRRAHRAGTAPARVIAPSYKLAHSRVVAAFGLAREHGCAAEGCMAAAADWAYDHADPDERHAPTGSPYSMNVEHYRPLCRRHHQRLDAHHRRVNRGSEEHPALFELVNADDAPTPWNAGIPWNANADPARAR